MTYIGSFSGIIHSVAMESHAMRADRRAKRVSANRSLHRRPPRNILGRATTLGLRGVSRGSAGEFANTVVRSTEMNQHSLQSRYREKLIEHLFIGELLRHSWHSRQCALEIARPEVDNTGYDIVAEEEKVIRHIQLKASHRRSRAASQKVHIALARKPSGCLVWIVFDQTTLDLGPFLFFGGGAGEPLPDISDLSVAKHTKPNAAGVKTERPNIRKVPKKLFRKYETVKDIYSALFVRAQPLA